MKVIKHIILFLVILILSIPAYYLHTIYKARAYTEAFILKDLQASQWRKFDPESFSFVADSAGQQECKFLWTVTRSLG